MARKIRKGRSTKRRLGEKSVNFHIAAVCEGANTEPNYLEDFTRFYGNNLVKVEPVPAAGAPLTIVNRAIEIKKDLKKQSSRDGFNGLYEVWAIFDIDEHPNIPSACDKAKANGIKLAISDPCFEIWPIIHFMDYRRPSHRHELQRKLSDVMEGYNHRTSKKLDFKKIQPSYEDARSRAIKLEEEHSKVGNAQGNPSTKIYKLLDTIIKQGKKK